MILFLLRKETEMLLPLLKTFQTKLTNGNFDLASPLLSECHALALVRLIIVIDALKQVTYARRPNFSMRGRALFL